MVQWYRYTKIDELLERFKAEAESKEIKDEVCAVYDRSRAA